MSDAPAGNNKNTAQREPHPAIKNVAVVQCDGFRCLAYRDENIWRELDTGKELPHVHHIVQTFTA